MNGGDGGVQWCGGLYSRGLARGGGSVAAARASLGPPGHVWGVEGVRGVRAVRLDGRGGLGCGGERTAPTRGRCAREMVGGDRRIVERRPVARGRGQGMGAGAEDRALRIYTTNIFQGDDGSVRTDQGVS